MKKLIVAILTFSALLTGCNAKTETNVKPNTTTDSSVDYSLDENWVYAENKEDRIADCFLLAPTAAYGEAGNMSIDDEQSKTEFKGLVNMQKGIYSDNCRVYAPFYRQATMSVYNLDGADSEKYFELAYADVKSAFEYYMQNYNDGRPVVIGGFSQGADMALRLLKDEFKNEEYMQKLVAAYIIGWRVTQADLDENPLLKTAEHESDTGVIVSFNSEAEDVTDSIIVPKGVKTLSINPLTWTTDTTPADETFNMGACFTDADGNISDEIYQFCGAYIDDDRGTLKVTGIDEDEYSVENEFFAKGVYHIYDCSFFYRNLQYNVAERVEAYYGDDN